MKKLSTLIEIFIKEQINDTDNGIVEIKRNELAQQFECAPSQINYVLDTRFTLEKGYHIESRRGGGGYIKIIKNNINDSTHIKNLVVNIIGESINSKKAGDIIMEFFEDEVITEREARIINSALLPVALKNLDKENEARANILKSVLLVLIEKNNL